MTSEDGELAAGEGQRARSSSAQSERGRGKHRITESAIRRGDEEGDETGRNGTKRDETGRGVLKRGNDEGKAHRHTRSVGVTSWQSLRRRWGQMAWAGGERGQATEREQTNHTRHRARTSSTHAWHFRTSTHPHKRTRTRRAPSHPTHSGDTQTNTQLQHKNKQPREAAARATRPAPTHAHAQRVGCLKVRVRGGAARRVVAARGLEAAR